MKRFSVGGLLAIAIVSSIAGCGGTVSPPVSTKGRIEPQQCGAVQQAIGVVASLAPGHVAADVVGGRLVVLATLRPVQSSNGGPSYLVLNTSSLGDRTAFLDRPSALAPPGVLSSVGVVGVHSSDAQLRSCLFHFDDAPVAQPLIASAISAAVKAGLTKASDTQSDAAVYLVSDDPIDPKNVIVTLAVPGPLVAAPDLPANAPPIHSHVEIIAVLGKASGTVIAIGAGSWG